MGREARRNGSSELAKSRGYKKLQPVEVIAPKEQGNSKVLMYALASAAAYAAIGGRRVRRQRIK